MLYNLALFPEREVSNAIISYADHINKDLDATDYEMDLTWVPHITLLKFEAKKPLSAKFISEMMKLAKKPLKVTFSGLTLLPSHKEGVWVEISILKNKELMELQEKLLQRVKNVKIISGRGNRFRLHITLSWIKNKKDICISKLDTDLLRKKDVRVFPQLGVGEKDFIWLKK